MKDKHSLYLACSSAICPSLLTKKKGEGNLISAFTGSNSTGTFRAADRVWFSSRNPPGNSWVSYKMISGMPAWGSLMPSNAPATNNKWKMVKIVLKQERPFAKCILIYCCVLCRSLSIILILFYSKTTVNYELACYWKQKKKALINSK